MVDASFASQTVGRKDCCSEDHVEFVDQKEVVVHLWWIAGEPRTAQRTRHWLVMGSHQ
jgi:hypothetical protein